MFENTILMDAGNILVNRDNNNSFILEVEGYDFINILFFPSPISPLFHQVFCLL
jgi:hypothetical protein